MSAEAHPLSMRPNPKHLFDFFSRSLTSFQSSQDVFRVFCTLPHLSNTSPTARPLSSNSNIRKLIVLDSSFNPPTKAHAQMAKSALEWAGGEEGGRRLMLLLSVNNADKAPKPASFPVRLGMMEGFGRALLESLRHHGEKGVEIDVAVTKMPYFHDKARAISEGGFYKDDTTTTQDGPEQVFLVGFDTVIRIFNPKYYPGGMKTALGPFFERARMRVTMRLDDEWGDKEEQEAYIRELGEGKLEGVGGDKAWAKRVDLVQGDGEIGGVSSSRVREMVKKGEGVRGLVDGEVMSWIDGEELYKND